MKMSTMNGIEFIKKAKKRFPDIVFFIVSGFEINSEIQEAIDTGLILKYFCKPYNLSEIKTAITETISSN